MAATFASTANATAPVWQFNGGGTGDRRARAEFKFDDNNTDLLHLTLFNMSTVETSQRGGLLSAVFFSAKTDRGLYTDLEAKSVFLAEKDPYGRDSKVIGLNTNNLQGSYWKDNPWNNELTGEYGFLSNQSWRFDQGSPYYGVSNSGLDEDGIEDEDSQDDWFGKPIDTTKNLTKPVSPDGSNFGIASTKTTSAPNNGSFPFTTGGVTITFSGASGLFTNLDHVEFTDIRFKYGTSWTEVGVPTLIGDPSQENPTPPLNPPAVPEPAFFAPAVLFGGGFVGVFLVGRRRRSSASGGEAMPA